MATKLMKSKDEEEEKILREENNRRTDEALEKVLAQKEKPYQREGDDERRRKALESIHRMEWLKNQDDIAASLQRGIGKGEKQRARKKERVETVKSLLELSTTADLPPPPPRNHPPPPPPISAWDSKSGAALFRGTTAALRVTYGIQDFDEVVTLNQVSEESLRHKELYDGVPRSEHRSNFRHRVDARTYYQTSTRTSGNKPPDKQEHSTGKVSTSGDEDDDVDYYQKGRQLAEARAKEREKARQIAAKEKEEQNKAAAFYKLSEPNNHSPRIRTSLNSPRSSPESLHTDTKKPAENNKLPPSNGPDSELPPAKPDTEGGLQPTVTSENQRKMWVWKDSQGAKSQDYNAATTPIPSQVASTGTPMYPEVVRTPISSVVSTMPISSRGPTALLSSGVTTSPISSGVFTSPISSGVFPSPISGRVPTAPISSVVSSSPIYSGVFASPIPSGVSTSPIFSGVSTSPISSGVFTSPISSGVPTAPIPSGVSTSPISSGVFTSPISSGVFTSPIPVGVASAPIYTEVYGAPVYAGEFTSAGYPGRANTPVDSKVTETVTLSCNPSNVIQEEAIEKKPASAANRRFTPEELICFVNDDETPANPLNSMDPAESYSAYQYPPHQYHGNTHPGMSPAIADANALQYNFPNPGVEQYYQSRSLQGSLNPEEQYRQIAQNGGTASHLSGPLLQAFQGLQGFQGPQMRGLANVDPSILQMTLYLNHYLMSHLGGHPSMGAASDLASLIPQLPEVPRNQNDTSKPVPPPVPPPVSPPLHPQMNDMTQGPGMPWPSYQTTGTTSRTPTHLLNPPMVYPGYAQVPTQSVAVNSIFIRAPKDRSCPS